MKNEIDLKPEILLVNPQLPENLGAVARAMLNFDFKKLRVVNPKFDLGNEKIIPISAGAEDVISNIKTFDKFEDSIKDFNVLIATTNRQRALKKKIISFEDIVKIVNRKKKIGFVFGPENSGLNNNHLSYSDYILQIPSNRNFSSLNLSHAVIIVCYELSKLNIKKSNFDNSRNKIDLALKSELMNFYTILENSLDKKGFFMVNERKKITIQKIRSIFSKLVLNSRELKILLGIIKALKK